MKIERIVFAPNGTITEIKNIELEPEEIEQFKELIDSILIHLRLSSPTTLQKKGGVV